jgi:hypothetical protein
VDTATAFASGALRTKNLSRPSRERSASIAKPGEGDTGGTLTGAAARRDLSRDERERF